MLDRCISDASPGRGFNLREGKGFTLIEGGSRSKARDSKRISDMRQLMSAQEMYYGSQDVYMPFTPSSPDFMPVEISDGVTTFIKVPTDPGGGAVVACDHASGIPAYTYCALDNDGEPQKYCYYARLENAIINKGGCTDLAPCPYMTVNHVGTFYKPAKPSDLDDCASGAQ
ncbi:MAG: type II secretion system GspH family protein [Candidatus Pacebacteria bacterium]|nr:type II secretion system GspH family protein [Candidatus Paceibacterota bacterium]